MPINFNDRVILGTVTGGSVTYDHNLQHSKAYSVQVKWAGTGIVGFAKLLASLNGEDWLEIPESKHDFTAAGQMIWDIEDANYKWVRVHCESTSGGVSFQAWLTTKREGGVW